MKKLTLEQAIVLTGFTGILCCKFSDFHEDVERRFDRPVFTHMFGDKDFDEVIKEEYREDFMEMIKDVSNGLV